MPLTSDQRCAPIHHCAHRPRVLRINELDVITNDVIEAARSTLVIGIS